jgi:SAM-dependent methyltransferase
MSQDQLTVVEANRRLYAELAETYDEGADWADPAVRERLRDALRQAVDLAPRDPRALDACGGSGSASLLLFEMGIHPVTVDLSPEMLAVYERKARAAGYAPETRVAEIEDFLSDAAHEYDLIVFASALHHMDDYVAVVERALDRLAPGGVVATMYDPARINRVGVALRRLDYVIHVIVHTPRRVPGLVGARLRRLLGRGGEEPAESDVGAIAERHALSGVDDLALVRAIEAKGAEVVAHPRYQNARFRLIRALVRATGQATSFSLIVRKPR